MKIKHIIFIILFGVLALQAASDVKLLPILITLVALAFSLTLSFMKSRISYFIAMILLTAFILIYISTGASSILSEFFAEDHGPDPVRNFPSWQFITGVLTGILASIFLWTFEKTSNRVRFVSTLSIVGIIALAIGHFCF